MEFIKRSVLDLKKINEKDTYVTEQSRLDRKYIVDLILLKMESIEEK